jgi:hypothetical protein
MECGVEGMEGCVGEGVVVRGQRAFELPVTCNTL